MRFIKRIIYPLIGGLVCLGFFNDSIKAPLSTKDIDLSENNTYVLELLKENLNKIHYGENSWPKEISINPGKMAEVEYTFNDKLTKYVKRLLRRYRSDYSAVIVIENSTGEILSAVGHEGINKKYNLDLAFSSSHPSASLFKIVTSAELLKDSEVDNYTRFSYRGKGTTLYKYQLNNKKTRWTRYLSLEKAFSLSNNVVFGKAAINHLNGLELYQMAGDFGFNDDLMDEITLPKSKFEVPKNQYNLAEKASGFNKKTTISPVHAALLASIVANDGVLRYPSVVENLKDPKTGQVLWTNETDSKRVLDYLTAMKLQTMMERVVKKGTGRRVFRRLPRKLTKFLNIGGKTGSITGGTPFGKRDWFSVYAVPKNEKVGKGISIAVMNINIDKWKVKSTELAKDIINYYFKKIVPIDKKTKELKRDQRSVAGV